MHVSSRKAIIISSSVAVVGIIIGFLIGWFSRTSEPLPAWTTTVQNQLKDLDESVILKYLERVSPQNIRDNLKYLAKEPHMAATPGDEKVVKYIDDLWKTQLDSSEVVSYEILLSFPSDDDAEPNVAEVYDKDGDKIFTTRTSETVYNEYMEAPESIVKYYNAYAPAGDVQGKLVYANRGSEADFAFLSDQGVDLNGTIALTKYGGVGRGTRTIYAKKYGVVGVLVYSDPEDYALEGDEGYPDDFSLPSTGVQRGSTLSEYGDPSTPRYPSIKSAYRIPNDENPYFPVLPLQPIAYEDAENLMKNLSYNASLIANGWSTGLNGKLLNVGPGFADGGYLRLTVNNKLRYVESKNVIGIITGSTEPDNWVMYGNHRDSWVYGAVDPSSGTACMLETTNIFGELLKSGWRPKRTIMFASWGAEEFGLIGSTEWAQENAFLLSERAVSYINVDIAVFANLSFFARASPLLTNVITQATEKVEDPNDSSKSILDTWMEYYPGPSPGVPYIGKLYTSSDYAYFYNALGVTSADLSSRGNSSERRYQISPYPTYHTAYDTFDYMDRFIDPGFTAHETVCKVSGSIMIQIADSLIIPFDLTAMAEFIQRQVDATVGNYANTFSEEKLRYLQEASQLITDNSANMIDYISRILDKENVLDIASVNNRIRTFEKSFIEPLGLSDSINYMHISGSNYGLDRGSFPSIDALLAGVDAPSNEIITQAEKQLAMITYRLLNAASILEIDY